MADNEQDKTQDQPDPKPNDNDLFAGPVHDELTEQDVFAAELPFFEQREEVIAPPAVEEEFLPEMPPIGEFAQKSGYSLTQKVLVAAILGIAAVMLYPMAIQAIRRYRPAPPQDPQAQAQPQPNPADTANSQTTAQQPNEPAKSVQTAGPIVHPQAQPLSAISLSVAESLYTEGSYEQAYGAYKQLFDGLAGRSGEKLMQDFMTLKMALCLKGTGDTEQASLLLRQISSSESPFIRSLAYYHRSVLEMQRNQFLSARMASYQAFALLESTGLPAERIDALRRDCCFVAAQALTRQILTLRDIDKSCPSELWPTSENDHVQGLEEREIRHCLGAGIARLNTALLGPEIQDTDDGKGGRLYTITCNGAPSEELLARFAANAGLDVQWNLGPDSTGIRKRAVTLYLPEVMMEDVVTVTVGYNGLLACQDEQNVLSILDPTQYTSLAEHIATLTEESIRLWRRFSLRHHEDERLPNVHFALGLMQTEARRPDEAIAEYKLVCNTFSRHKLAPYALLNSSRVRTNLLDYAGAQKDLKQLVEQYPDTSFADQACLYLADATLKTGMADEAVRLYTKVYHLAVSAETQRAAALGAGTGHFNKQEYGEAAKWLTRYVNLVKDMRSQNLPSACLMLGKANMELGQAEEAKKILRFALRSMLSKEQYVETLLTLVQAHLAAEEFLEALDILDSSESQQFSQEHALEVVLLKARVLCKIGLADIAAGLIKHRAQYLVDPELKAKANLELGRCLRAQGLLPEARQCLSDVLVYAKPGKIAQEVQQELALICFDLGQDEQTISVCLELLQSKPNDAMKESTLKLLAEAYTRQEDYERAAQALIGRWSTANISREKMSMETPGNTARY